MTAVVFTLAAAIGAVCRWGVGRIVCDWQALLVVNTAGSAVLGWVLAADLSTSTDTVIGVGFCGGLTTFSSFVLEVRTLGWRIGTAFAAVSIGCATLAASIGSTLA